MKRETIVACKSLFCTLMVRPKISKASIYKNQKKGDIGMAKKVEQEAAYIPHPYTFYNCYRT